MPLRKIILIVITIAGAIVLKLAFDRLQAPAIEDAPIAAPSPPANSAPRIFRHVRENLTLKKDLDLGAMTLDTIFSIEADGLTIDCAGHRIVSRAETGIVANDVRGLTVKNCLFEGVRDGLASRGARDVAVRGGAFTVRRHGIRMQHAAGVVVDGVTFRATEHHSLAMAVEFTLSENVAVENCVVRGFDQGILFVASREVNAANNDIADIVETGIGTFQGEKLNGSGPGVIRGNKIVRAMMGLEIDAGSFDLEIADNEIRRCESWLRLSDGGGEHLYNPLRNIRFVRNRIDQRIDVESFGLQDATGIFFENNVVEKRIGEDS
ncbi:MAG: right-handed parallel beta-helix repeat-containing protein [Deltaproteobacteria bacterium]|nr:right-handed parallel beta-helix repeat-containing protein [Deltaproteobacteria bacterium]